MRTTGKHDELLELLEKPRQTWPYPRTTLQHVSGWADDYSDRDPSKEEECGTHLAEYDEHLKNSVFEYLDEQISLTKAEKSS